MLKTLGYRIPADRIDELLGEVYVHRWSDAFADAWAQLPRGTFDDGAPARPAYRQLVTGLVAAHGGPVHLIDEWGLSDEERRNGTKGMILSTTPFNPFHLRTCLQTFERLLRGGEGRDTLAASFGPSSAAQLKFSSYVGRDESGTVDAPGWVFESARWSIAALLNQPLSLEANGPSIALRMDTDGSLLSWDRPVSNEWKEWVGYAMLRIRPRIITLPGMADLVVTFDANMSRIATEWRGNKTAWIDRRDKAKPVLRVPIRCFKTREDKWTQEIRNFAAEIAKACDVEALDLDANLPATPGRVRPLVPGPQRHPIGKGPGARVMLRVAEHIDAYCPALEPLSWSKDKTAKIPTAREQRLGPPAPAKKATRPRKKAAAAPKKTTTRPPPPPIQVLPETIVGALRAANQDSVRLLCLYATSEARARMAGQLENFAKGSVPSIDGQVATPCEGFEVSFHRAVKLLEHGSHDRSGLLAEIDSIVENTKGTVLAWVETAYDGALGKPTDDAKMPVKELLADRGITTQFLATQPEPTDTEESTTKKKPKRRKKAETDVDHAAENAASDLLLRSAGVLHPELAQSALGSFLIGTTAAKVHLVGLHLRSQTSRRRDVPPRLVVTAVDIQAMSDPSLHWPVRMWSDKHSGWTPHPQALAAFHAGPIGSTAHGRGKKVVPTRLYIESILDALPDGPVVLFIDAPSTRSFWPGLQNRRFSTGLLPGANLAGLRNVAIVRCNNSEEIPRPVNRTGGRQPADPRKPATPEHCLYQEPTSGVWLFGKSSRIYRSGGRGRAGADYTPWTVPEDLCFLLQDDWHSYTATEIAVARTGGWDKKHLAMLTARLCDHTIAWDDRTLTPLPLHLASRADLTHPNYRSQDDE